MYLEQMTYWHQLVDHYYDNEHWKHSDICPTGSIAEWIKHEFDGTVDWVNKKIYFSDPKRLSWFVLKWA